MSDLFRTLHEKEVYLHQVLTKENLPRWQALLHPEFAEFGRSGGRISRADVLDGFMGVGASYTVHAQDFQLAVLSADSALLTYRSCHIAKDGSISRYTNRSSIWLKLGDSWCLRFHQGTPTEAFAITP